MGATATITPPLRTVDPGGQADFEVRVRNTGTIVDQFDFGALGDAAPWATFSPPSVSLFPDAEGVANVSFRPPRSADTTAGPVPVGITVRSKEDPESLTVEEVTLEIGRMTETFAELIPRTSRGRRGATHNLAVDNRGNSRLNATLSAADPDDRLRFSFTPPAIVAEPGTAAFSKLDIRPLKRFLRGPDVTHSFTVLVEPEDSPPIPVDGTMLQLALIPPWAPRAVLGALAALLALMVLWATLLKPTVESAAEEAAKEVVRDEVAPALQETSKQIGELAKKVGAPPPPPIMAAGGTTTTAPPTGGPGTGTTGGTAALGEPFDGRLEAEPGKQTVSVDLPEGKTFSLTDIVLQNPGADSGILRLQRKGKDLLVVSLDNFRDLDYHFVAPVRFTSEEPLTLNVTCQKAAPPNPPKPCPAVYYSGYIR